MITPLVACTRMYNATESVAQRWADFAGEVARTAGVPLRFDRYAPPNDIMDLWQREDLGLTFICGRPFTLGGQRHKPIAVPLRSGTGRPLYHTKLLVREESPFQKLEDSFGSRLGWTVTHSQSGYLAVMQHLRPYRRAGGAPLYREEVGPLHTPANCISALLEDKADIVPLDGYYHDLLQKNAPAALAGTRTLAVTEDRPMPFLCASASVPDEVCERLHGAVQQTAALPVMRDTLEALCIQGFTRPIPSDYTILGGN